MLPPLGLIEPFLFSFCPSTNQLEKSASLLNSSNVFSLSFACQISSAFADISKIRLFIFIQIA
jgi:hypothetical protein